MGSSKRSRPPPPVASSLQISRRSARGKRTRLSASPDSREAAARAWYAQFDRDGDGVLSSSEFRALLNQIGSGEQKLHPKYAEHVLDQTDIDHDGVISIGDFMRVYDRLCEMERVLCAPRRAPRALGDLLAASRVRARPSLTCPQIETHNVDVGKTTFCVPTRYTELERIGEGAYGVICCAIDSQDGAQVAIKRVRPAADAMQLRCCLRELAILRHLSTHEHANLLGLKAVLPPPAGHLSEWSHLYLVLPLMDTDLHQLIKSDQPLTDEHCAFFMWQLLRGLHALHSAGIIHRDIKPSNLLVNANCDLKIGDFGISRGVPSNSELRGLSSGAATAHREDDEVALLTSYAVTRWYRPPELLCGNRRYGKAIDLWSAGCVLAELLGRAPVFAETDHMAMLRAIVAQLGTPSKEAYAGIEDPRAERFVRSLPPGSAQEWAERYPDASKPAIQLLSGLLRFQPSRRFTAAEAVSTEWFSRLASPEDTLSLPRCPFDFEECQPNLDVFFLAGLDAVHSYTKDYPFRIPEMLRFGIMHDRTVYPGAHSADEPNDDSDVPQWPDDPAPLDACAPAAVETASA